MGVFRYLRPDENVVLDAVVTGSVDPAYLNTWICDGRPGFPVLGDSTGSPGGDLSLHLVPLAAGDVDFVAATHLRVDEAVDIEVTGDVTQTLATRGATADDIPLNRWESVTLASAVDSLTVTVSNNSVPPVIGEFFAGPSRTLPRKLRLGMQRSFQPFAIPSGAEFGSVLPYDKGLHAEILQGTQTYDASATDAIVQWLKASRNGTRASVIVPDDDLNDCYVVLFQALTITQITGTLLDLTFTFVEIPRQRW